MYVDVRFLVWSVLFNGVFEVEHPELCNGGSIPCPIWLAYTSKSVPHVTYGHHKSEGFINHQTSISVLFSLHTEHNRGGSKKRSHHFAVKDEIDEDDLSDELSNQAEKKRRLTVEQVKFLEMSFNKDLKLEPERKALLAKQLGIRPRQVAIWFQNRRARWKNKQLEQDYETLKAKCDTILKEKEIILREHEAALEENKRLQAQVVHLMSLLESPASNGVHDVMGVGSEGKSDLTSPTKSVEDQSDMQDSGQSYTVSEGVVGVEIIGPTHGEIDPVTAWTMNVKMESEFTPNLPGDDVFGNIPSLVHHIAANTYYLEDVLFYNCEEHFTGLPYYG